MATTIETKALIIGDCTTGEVFTQFERCRRGGRWMGYHEGTGRWIVADLVRNVVLDTFMDRKDARTFMLPRSMPMPSYPMSCR